MGNKSSAPAAPDFSGLVNAANAQSARFAGIMDDQLAFAKEAYNRQLPRTEKFQDAQYDAMLDSNEFARAQRAQYQNLYQPLAEEFVGDARAYTSADQMAAARGRAMGTVGMTFDIAGDAAKRNLESYGIDPSATRYAGLDVGARTAKAAATAAAATKSDVDREATGLGLKTAALNIGNGLPGQFSGLTGTGTAAGSAGVGAGNSTYSTFSPSLGNPTAWGGMSSNALGMAGSFTNMGYQGQLGQYQANAQNSTGIGAILGTAAGIGSMFMSDERSKENIKDVGETYDGQPVIRFNYKGDPRTQIGLSAQETEKHHPEAVATGPDGLKRVDYRRALPAVGNRYAAGGPVDMAGGMVPPGMSPSGGMMTDDVPAQVGPAIGGPPEAAINVGEFVLPEDVTRWLGEEKIQKMIVKARQDKEQAVAQPEQGPAIGGSPPPVQAGALPIRPQAQMGVGA